MSRPPRDADAEDEELEALVGELAETLDALRTELDGGRGGGSPTPRPPRTGDLLRFTEQYTIPTIISVLEASIRSLELLRGALRLADGRIEEATPSNRDRNRDRGGRALDVVDGLLDDIGDAVEGRPAEPEARDLLAEARALRGEIDDRIAGRSRPSGGDREREREREEIRSRTGARGRQRGAGRDDAVRIDVSEADAEADADEREGPTRQGGEGDAARESVDVEAELDAIKREVHGEDDAEDDPEEH